MYGGGGSGNGIKTGLMYHHLSGPLSEEQGGNTGERLQSKNNCIEC